MNENTASLLQVERLQTLSEDYLTLLRRQEAPSVAEFAARYPDYAEKLEEYLPILIQLEQLDPCAESQNNGVKIADYSAPSTIGEYELIRELGRGGMGIVYEARHRTMRRRVALKILPSALTHQKDGINRFIREARAAGQLHHTNIVPVFEVGEADGVHFYAMQLIEGQNLSEIIKEIRRIEEATEPLELEQTLPFPSPHEEASVAIAQSLVLGPPRTDVHPESSHHRSEKISSPAKISPEELPATADTTVMRQQLSDTHRLDVVGDANENFFHRAARVGLQVADALQHAHKNGVLHRDIKPSNLLLDSTGCVWITDFGLAKEELDNLTATGDIVGTLRYMAPERFTGHTDARSDVYSLGLTLYELCTLRYAFDEVDRARLMNRLMTDAPRPPREVRRDIPKDLETIILKSIARAKEKRYQSAEELAADLRRFVEHRPIQARRISTTERCFRWCKRNPVVASSILVTLLLAITLTIVSARFAYLSQLHATKLGVERNNARAGFQRANEHLFFTHVDKAKALRHSDEAGRNFKSMQAILWANQLLPDLNKSPEEVEQLKFELRNQAVSSMVVMDMRAKTSWPIEDPATKEMESSFISFDYKNGRFAQADREGNVRIRRTIDNSIVKTIKSNGQKVWKVQFAPGGRCLAITRFNMSSMQNATLRVWDAGGNELKYEVKTDSGFASIKFSETGDELVIGRGSGTVSILETATGNSILELDVNQKGTQSVIRTQLAGHRLITVPYRSNKIQIWDLTPEPRIIRTLDAPNNVTTLSWHLAKGILAVGCIDDSTYVWRFDWLPKDDIELEELSGPWTPNPAHVLTGHVADVKTIAIRPQGDVILTSGWDATTRLYELDSDAEVVRIDGFRATNDGFSPDGSTIGFASLHRELGLWELVNDRPIRSVRLAANSKLDRRLLFHPQIESLIGVANEKGVALWNCCEDVKAGLIETGDTSDFRFSEDGKYLYTSGKKGIQKHAIKIEPLDDGSYQFEISDSKTLVNRPTTYFHLLESQSVLSFLDPNHSTTLLDLNSLEELKLKTSGWINSVQVSFDGKYVFTTAQHSRGVMVWDRTNGEKITTLVPKWLECTVRPSPDGKQVFIESVLRRCIISIGDWKMIRDTEREVPESLVGAIHCSRDGKRLLTSHNRYTPQLLDAKTHKTLVRFESPTKDVYVANLQFDRSGDRIMFNNENIVYIWDLRAIESRLEGHGIGWK